MYLESVTLYLPEFLLFLLSPRASDRGPPSQCCHYVNRQRSLASTRLVRRPQYTLANSFHHHVGPPGSRCGIAVLVASGHAFCWTGEKDNRALLVG